MSEKERSEELKQDIQEIRDTLKNDKGNSIRKIKYKLKKNSEYVLGGVIVAMFAYFWFFDGMEIPEWVYVYIAAIIISAMSLYPLANWVVNLFVEDKRKPALNLNQNEEKVYELYSVPEERIPDIRVSDGSGFRFQTQKGQGIQFEEFEVIEEQGEQYAVATGCWEGSKSSLELKEDYTNIESMRNNLVPQAQKGWKYEIKQPEIVHRISTKIINNIIYEFQGISNFSGKEIHKEIQSIVDSETVESEETEDEKDTEIEELEEMKAMMDGNMKKMMNGDSHE